MKKVVLVLPIFLLIIGLASAALEFDIEPDNVAIPFEGQVHTYLYATNNGIPVSDLPVQVGFWCKELVDPDYVCNDGDEWYTDEITVTVSSPTGTNGRAMITLNSTGTGQGRYHYTICDKHHSEVDASCAGAGASATGDAHIPELTTVGAALVLTGAGLLIYRKKKNGVEE